MTTLIGKAAELAGMAAAELSRELKAAVTARGHASLMLAGGKTPEAAYAVLGSRAEVPWPQISIYFTDERAVAPDSDQSNYAMVARSLLRLTPQPPQAVHRMLGEAQDLNAAARAYAALLPEAVDVLVLGIGEDGHTASIFPHAPAASEKHQRVLAVEYSPKPPAQRLTVTPPVVTGARFCMVLAAGLAKARAVAWALEGPLEPEACPAQRARAGLWLLDADAASKLKREPVGA